MDDSRCAAALAARARDFELETQETPAYARTRVSEFLSHAAQQFLRDVLEDAVVVSRQRANLDVRELMYKTQLDESLRVHWLSEDGGEECVAALCSSWSCGC
jgi:hypothetical protein